MSETGEPQEVSYRRVLVKVSGEALMGSEAFGLHWPTIEASPAISPTPTRRVPRWPW